MSKKVDFSKMELVDEVGRPVTNDEPKSTNKFIKKKKETRDYSWNDDVRAALLKAGIIK